MSNTKARHDWTPQDDEQLRLAVEACLPLRERLGNRRYFWAAVCGRIADIGVTGDACRCRWDHLQTDAAQQLTRTTGNDGWERSLRLLHEHEAQEEREEHEAQLDQLANSLRALDVRLAKINALLDTLCLAWGVIPPGEEIREKVTVTGSVVATR